MDKSEKRSRLLKVRAGITDREKKNEKILSCLTDIIEKVKPINIFCYVSMGSEVDTKEFLNKIFGKYDIYVPYTCNKTMTLRKLLDIVDLETDKLGNIKTKYLGEECDSCAVTIVPMVGYNKKNIRMGYGGGYYDRYISSHKTLTIGLAYNEQMDNDLPTEAHDCAVNIIISQNGVQLCE